MYHGIQTVFFLRPSSFVLASAPESVSESWLVHSFPRPRVELLFTIYYLLSSIQYNSFSKASDTPQNQLIPPFLGEANQSQ